MYKPLSVLLVLFVSFSSLGLHADEFIHEWIEQDAAGDISGRVVVPGRYGSAAAVAGAKVTLRPYNKQTLLKKQFTDETGRFRFANITPGAYVLISESENTLACGVIHVLPHDQGLGNDEVEIPAATIDRVTVRTAVLRYLSARWDDNLRHDLPKSSLAFNGTPLRVALIDKGVNGRLMRDPWNGADQTNVFVFRNGLEIARTVTLDDGWFRVEQLEPGKYSILGVGRHGLCATGIQLIDTRAIHEENPTSDSERNLIAQAENAPPAFALQLAPPPAVSTWRSVSQEDEDDDIAAVETEVIPSETDLSVPQTSFASPAPYATPTAYNYPTGGGGGSGFSGSSGSIGGISGLGPIGGAIAILASDDDGVIPATPPSPIVP